MHLARGREREGGSAVFVSVRACVYLCGTSFCSVNGSCAPLGPCMVLSVTDTSRCVSVSLSVCLSVCLCVCMCMCMFVRWGGLYYLVCLLAPSPSISKIWSSSCKPKARSAPW
jgi:hypothetical protein